MPTFRSPRRAAVLAAALDSWAKTTHDGSTSVARVELRQAPEWSYTGKTTLTDGQVTRLLGVLRADLIPPGPTTPLQAAAAVDQILAEWSAAGRTRISAADLVGELPRIGQTRSWLAEHLCQLVDDAYLREGRRPGTYRIA